MFKVFLIIIILLLPTRSFSDHSETFLIPCNDNECDTKLKETVTWIYYSHNNNPALIWLPGGHGSTLSIDYNTISLMEGKLDVIIMASPIKIVNSLQQGGPGNGDAPRAYDKRLTYRTKQVIEFYKKKLNKPIWLGGHSNGGPRLVGYLLRDKSNANNLLSGLIFSSPNVGYGRHRSHPAYRIKIRDIKNWKLNIPALVINHKRDGCGDTVPENQRWLTNQIKKINENKTELILLNEGYEKETRDCHGGHHLYFSNRKEAAETIFKFIKENTK